MDTGDRPDDAGAKAPRYLGEDPRPTSPKELRGFFTYGWAAEPFVVCGLGAFIPIALETLARESATAVLANDHTQPCGSATSHQGNASGHGSAAHSQSTQCEFLLFGNYINTASFAMYTFSISVFLQALLVVTMSAAADHGRYRKSLLIGFALAGSVATMLFLPVTPRVYLLGSLWAMVGNVCVGATFVLLNSFLPLLVRHHPGSEENEGKDCVRLPSGGSESFNQEIDTEETPQSDDLDDSNAALIPSVEPSAFSESAYTSSTAIHLSTKISSRGVGIGYIASVIVQMLSLVIIQATGSSFFSVRLVLFVVGFWWLVFTIPAAMWLRPRPGPPLKSRTRTWTGYVVHSWVSLGKTVLRARRLKDVLLFLAAWFMISDGIATISGTAILFAKTTLGMNSSALALINVIVTVSGIAGAFTWSRISHSLRLKPSHTILTCVCIFAFIPLYGLLGYVPAIQRLGHLGLQQPWEMYPLGAVFGIVIGGLSSYCRSLYGELIPPGSEAAFFALYAITDKGSSVFGPAIVGAITDAAGDIRPAFWFLAALLAVPIPIMALVDVERGKREAAALARESGHVSRAMSRSSADHD